LEALVTWHECLTLDAWVTRRAPRRECLHRVRRHINWVASTGCMELIPLQPPKHREKLRRAQQVELAAQVLHMQMSQPAESAAMLILTGLYTNLSRVVALSVDTVGARHSRRPLAGSITLNWRETTCSCTRFPGMPRPWWDFATALPIWADLGDYPQVVWDLKDSVQRSMLGSANNQTSAEDGAMNSIPQSEAIDKLPVVELEADLDLFLQPLL